MKTIPTYEELEAAKERAMGLGSLLIDDKPHDEKVKAVLEAVRDICDLVNAASVLRRTCEGYNELLNSLGEVITGQTGKNIKKLKCQNPECNRMYFYMDGLPEDAKKFCSPECAEAETKKAQPEHWN